MGFSQQPPRGLSRVTSRSFRQRTPSPPPLPFGLVPDAATPYQVYPSLCLRCSLPSQVTREEPVSGPASPHRGYNRGAGKPLTGGRITSPSSLPYATADSDSIVGDSGDGSDRSDCLGEAASPERTTTVPPVDCKSDSPERTGEAVSAVDGISVAGVGVDGDADDGEGAPAGSSQLQLGGEGVSGEQTGVVSSDESARLEIEVRKRAS